MNTLRELILILSTLTFLGGLTWVIWAIVATGVVPKENVADVAPRTSYLVCAGGLLAYLLTAFVWKKKKAN